jgi:hypothetical protein
MAEFPALPKGSTATRRGRWVRAALWLAATVAVLAAAGRFAVPPLVRHLLVSRLGAALHRPVAVREVRCDPFRLTLAIAGFTIGERERSGEFFGFEELFVDLEAVSILQRAPVVREIRLRGPRVHIARSEDGRTYNFSDLLGSSGAPPPAAAAPRRDPVRFALHNIRVTGGRIAFEDRPRAARHEVADLELTVPFVSNLPARVDTFEQPSLSAVVNGAPFRLAGQTKPFKESLETVVELDLEKVDVPRYLAYLPADLGFTVREGLLGAKLSASFAQSPRGGSLIVRGGVRLDRVAIAERDGSPLLSFASLDLSGLSLDVFRRRLEIDAIHLASPEATLALREKGGLNWAGAFPASAGRQDPPEQEAKPWSVQVREVRLADGRVHWRDEAVPGGFSADLTGIEAAVTSLEFPQRNPAGVELRCTTGFGESLRHRGSLRFSPLAWEGDLELAGVRPRAWEAYYRRATAYEIREGVLGASGHLRLAAQDGGTTIGITGLAARLDRLRVRRRGAAADFLTLENAELARTELDLPARRLSVGSLLLRTGNLALVREADGSILPGVPPSPGPEARSEPAPPVAASRPPEGTREPSSAPPAERPWLLEAASVRLAGCGVTLADRTIPGGLTHTVGALALDVAGFSTKPGTRTAFRLSAGINGEGRLAARGDFRLAPLGAQLELDLKNLAIVPWYPYYADRVNFVTSSGAVSAHGTLAVAPDEGGAPAASFRGNAALTGFAAVDRLNAEEMLTVQSLALGTVAFSSSPFSLAIEEAILADFYSRLIIFPDGRLNVQKALGGDAPETGPGAAPAAAAGSAPAPVSIARLVLQQGTVSFSDRFVKPNYSALLTDLTGDIAGLSSKAGTTAAIAVRGRLDHSAPVTISGAVNPLAGNLFLDLKAAVSDIELGSFTPYSGKYLGYGIEKGKMRFDVAYRIENRTLAAENRLVLDQLTFGPKIESPEATALPVQLAVALLKDRHGVIDLNLPLGGSLDDPEFSVGRLILQVLLNLIAKAATSPFALLGSLFGGGAELSFAEFEPGSEVPLPEARTRVEALRTALVERPGLRLEITGHADPDSDRESLRRRRFERSLKARKLKDIAGRGTAAPPLDAIVIEPAEYERYLRLVYREAKFPRPRTFIGLLKELPLAETESLLLANTTVTDDDLSALANRRAQAAKDLLTDGAGVAPERVFLLAPIVKAPDPGAERPSARVEFTLK